MSDDEISIAVAEALGWYGIRIQDRIRGFINSDEHTATWMCVPDYPNDLNACHEMEKTLTAEQWGRYAVELGRVLNWRFCETWSDAAILLHATARQRCEAFLRTIGKWVTT